MWCMGVVLAMVVVAATALRPQVSEQEESEQYFEESGRPIELKTVWDFRYVRTDATASWLERALGKARYGGEGSERRSLFRVPQASFVVDTQLANSLTTHLHVNLDLEREIPEGRYGWDRIRLIEAFADWRWAFDAPRELRVEGGMFFPPVSLEHIGDAWTTFYTVTPSAINTWIGEEVRATGTELTLAHVGVANEVGVKGAAFWNSDPSGSLLAYRGFAIHDRQTGWRDRLPLPPLQSLEPGGIFEQQAPYVEPLVEIDDRAGYCGAVSWENYQFFEVNALYFDNRGHTRSLRR